MNSVGAAYIQVCLISKSGNYRNYFSNWMGRSSPLHSGLYGLVGLFDLPLSHSETQDTDTDTDTHTHTHQPVSPYAFSSSDAEVCEVHHIDVCVLGADGAWSVWAVMMRERCGQTFSWYVRGCSLVEVTLHYENNTFPGILGVILGLWCCHTHTNFEISLYMLF